MPEPVVRVLVVDDQAMVREGFAALLAAQPDLEVVGTAADGQAAVDLATELTAAGRRPDVVLMDVRMPRRNGIEATADLLSDDRFTGLRVLVLTTFDLDDHVYAALRAGACLSRKPTCCTRCGWSPGARRCWTRRSPSG